MAYTWEGMGRLSLEEVKKLHESGELAGYFYLYDDGSEGEIPEDYELDDIVSHYENGGEFGYEK